MLYRRPARRPIAPRAPRARRTPRGRGRRDHARLPWLIGTAALVVAAGVAVGILETTGGTTGGSTALSPVLPASFEVVYQVITSTTGTPSTTWEVLHSADPFDTSDLTYDANPLSGAKPVSGTVSTFDHLYDLASGSLTLVTDRQPGQGSEDQALVPELGDLQHRHLAAPTGGQRRVAGQMCSTFRFSEPPVGAITPQSGTDHDNLCLSPSGLELAEQWTYVGRSRTRTDCRRGDDRWSRRADLRAASCTPAKGAGGDSTAGRKADADLVPSDSFSSGGLHRHGIRTGGRLRPLESDADLGRVDNLGLPARR